MTTGLGKVKKVKLAKIDALKKAGVKIYPDVNERPDTILSVKKHFEELVISQKNTHLAGRIMAKREHGGSTFVVLDDGSETIQLYFKQDLLGVEQYQLFLDNFDIGDFVDAKGPVFITRRGEQTQEVRSFFMLAKALLPLPEKWHGLADVDERFRKRYLDLLMNEDVRSIFVKRSATVKAMRTFLESEGFMEVETPILQTVPGGAIAEPFKTKLNALHMDLYMRVAPELYLKRLLVGGFQKVYEIGRCFRNEGMDATHNPDFTMMECYDAYASYKHMMERVERMIRFIVENVLPHNHLEIERDGKVIDFKSKFDVISFGDLLKKYADINYDDLTEAQLAKKAKSLKIKLGKGAGKGKIADEIYKVLVRPNIIQPTFMIYHPLELSPLAKLLPDDNTKVARFQLIVAGMEIANGYSELNDPIDQAARFKDQEKTRKHGDKEAQRMDEDFVEALEYGMPPAAGLGVGIERLVALLTGAHSVREVMLFPTMRPKK